MRILIISEAYPPYYMGGYELRCMETADELVKRGHEVVVLTSWWGLDQACIDGSIYRQLNINPAGGLSPKSGLPDLFHLRNRTAQLKWFSLSRKNYHLTKRLISSLKPDVAYIWKLYNTGTGPIQALQEDNIPTIFTLGSEWLSELKAELFLESNPLKRRFRLAMYGLRSFQQLELKYLITVSQSLKNTYVKYGFPEKNITIIPRGIPSEWSIDNKAEEKVLSKNAIRLLFVGRLCDEKAPDDAIKTLSILVNRMGIDSFQLDIAGTGKTEYLDWLKELVVKLNLSSHVNFLGKVAHQDILEAYSQYDILLFPSRWEEPIGGTILEAMARGLPVIASNRGGIPELITDNYNGLIVNANEPMKIAQAVYRVIKEEGLRNKLRSGGLRTIRERYTLESVVDRTEAYFHVVLDGIKSPVVSQSL